MSKYTITHTCGHERTYNICGPTKDRDRKAAWLAGQDCPDCRRAAEHSAATAAGEAAAAANNLPALEGTEKQVAWASAIRGLAVAAIDRADLREDARPALIAAVAAHTEARWWIDNRIHTDALTEFNPLCAEAVAKMDKEGK